MDPGSTLQHFLQPLQVDAHKIHTLSSLFLSNFKDLALHAQDQFLSTPISESILRHVSQEGRGRHLAIDIGGTNLRVGLVELGRKYSTDTNKTTSSKPKPNGTSSSSTLKLKEEAWPIDDRVKADAKGDPQLLFDWIGARIASVVRNARKESLLPDDDESIPMGITFSFPMIQRSIAEAQIMTMGKGFSIKGYATLGPLLIRGYDKARDAQSNGIHSSPLPPIHAAAISNDSVSTLITFIYLFDEFKSSPKTKSKSESKSPSLIIKKASMGLIVGTGCNATISLPLTALGPGKWPEAVSTLPGEPAGHIRIAVNTEWSIRGTAPPLRELGFITAWDTALDEALVGPGEIAGFQPLEYMTAGRYLGELGRLVLVDYLRTVLGFDESSLPEGLLTRYALTTTFLSHFKPADDNPSDPSPLQSMLEKQFPVGEVEAGTGPSTPFQWTPTIAAALYHIAKAIEIRAAGIVAAATFALLKLAEDVPPPVPKGHHHHHQDENHQHDHHHQQRKQGIPPSMELGVGYTGGCISHFQDYLADTQDFLDKIVKLEYSAGGPESQSPLPVRIVLSPCHDGGIKGAGILVAATRKTFRQET
ncbi:hexokinase-1 [Colletotrichum limetticola]|uniref:Phosphotransferase n=1 Tax=Colletotrichum limetticola TaxID=1209924 RepID=A0ABQ9Q2N1_9PEZI|nr:hexokinase-1 [Colletotrichum limetticola]